MIFETLEWKQTRRLRDVLRAWGRERRQKLAPCDRAQKSRAWAAHFAGMVNALPASKLPKTVALYVPFTAEVDVTTVLPLLSSLAVDVVYPHVTSPTAPLTFGSNPSTPPPQKGGRRLTRRDWMLVPGLVFDSDGNRLGFGKGYYDRTLAKTEATSIGVCFEAQICTQIPTLAHDIPVDVLLSDEALRKTSRFYAFRTTG